MSRRAARTVARVVGLGVLCLALAACGGQHATRRQVVVRANAICQGTLDDIRAVPPPRSRSAADLSTYFAKVEPILDREATQIGKLPRPANGRATLARFVSAVQAADRDYHVAAAAALRGDSGAVDTALGALRTTGVAQLATRYGMTVCAGGGATIG